MIPRSNLLAFIIPNDCLPSHWGIYSILEARWLPGTYTSKVAANTAVKIIERDAIIELATEGRRLAMLCKP